MDNPSLLVRAGRSMIAAIRALRQKSIADVVAYGFVSVVGLPCMYWAILDTKPAAKAFGEVITPVVRQGEMLTVRYDVDRQRSCQLRAWRVVIDSASLQYTVLPDGRWVNEGRDTFVVSVPVPLAANLGPAKYRATILFVYNPWQRWIWPLEKKIKERTFQIVAGTPTAGRLQ